MYSDFAYVYDLLMQDVKYTEWADYIELLFRKFCVKKPELVLDMACGTGNLTLELAKRGYDMIGIDMSSDMLSCAMEKSVGTCISPLWVCQDMRAFELYGTMDVILCTMDSLNYIQNAPDMTQVFHLVNNYLNPGGLFVFDMNTPYKLEHVLGNNLFYEIRDDITYLWRNQYLPKEKKCIFDLTFFVKEGEDIYRRLEEEQQEKAWAVEEIQRLLKKAGLELVGMYGEFTESAPSEQTERVFFIARRPQ
ncbi:MAG: class I SAM-dependent methyltransferase [Thermoclostridium sp.]|nr:class I SAM-dependent methyltransferase [Thermoclostridium sp.]